MTAQAVATDYQHVKERPSEDRRPLLVIPALLAVSLGMMPFLGRDGASDMLVQVTIAVLILLGLIDFLTWKVPNIVVYPAIAFALAGTAIIDTSFLPEAALGGGVLLGVMFMLALIGRGAMGMGDVKFACIAGCLLGWQLGLIALATGFAVGAIVAVVLLVFRLRDRKDSVPLTPFLAAGIIFWLLLGSAIVAQSTLS